MSRALKRCFMVGDKKVKVKSGKEERVENLNFSRAFFL
jgi:hypothetical protein